MVSLQEITELTKEDLVEVIEFVGSCLSVTDEKGLSSLIRGMKSFVPYNFTTYGVAKVEDVALSGVTGMVNVNCPEEWTPYINDNFFIIDPVRTRFSIFRLLIWSETYQRYSNVDPKFLYIVQNFRLTEGLTCGVIEPDSSIASLFSFADASKKLSCRHIALLERIVPHLHQALIRILRKNKTTNISQESDIVLPLSLREKEVLNWLKLGKTNWEISVILKISERTVKFHVHNIMKKLNAVTRGHAVAKAISLEMD
jgi:DNA-binding CsgD family transcriptional regulator